MEFYHPWRCCKWGIACNRRGEILYPVEVPTSPLDPSERVFPRINAGEFHAPFSGSLNSGPGRIVRYFD